MISVVLGLLATGLGIALITVYGFYAKTKLTVAQLEDENRRLRIALGVGQGYLENISTSSFPGLSDGATTTLARIDKLIQEEL